MDENKNISIDKFLVCIPTYNNATTLSDVIDGVKEYCPNVLVINDGSTDHTLDIIKDKNINSLSYKVNRGKGYALKLALKYAKKYNYEYLITIDADGQHFPEDIPSFIQYAQENPIAIIIGARNLNAHNMPGKNTFGNKFSNFWFFVETGIKMDDTQSGFRLYPVSKLSNLNFITQRYEFEVEVIVRGVWKGLNIKNIPIKVYYAPKEVRVSHFRPSIDFTRISILNSILVIYALLFYYPWKFLKSINKENIQKAIYQNITHSKESNLKISGAISLGVFFGIIPLWGYQMITAALVAHFLKLNKVLTLISSNISIPPMIPLILYGSYVTGGIVLNRKAPISFKDISLETVSGDILQYIIGSVIFAIVCSFTAFVLSYVLMIIFKRKPTCMNE